MSQKIFEFSITEPAEKNVDKEYALTLEWNDKSISISIYYKLVGYNDERNANWIIKDINSHQNISLTKPKSLKDAVMMSYLVLKANELINQEFTPLVREVETLL